MAPQPHSSNVLALHDAVALAGRFPLLAGLDLEVAAGETVLVEGANGAGKTSLLRVCAGLVPVASGRVAVFGLDPVRRRAQVRRRVGLLSHAAHLYDDLTVLENVTFAVRAAGGDAARVEGACGRFGLTGRLLRSTAAKLSAGQRRRVALAVLVARWPDLWLLDEPHAGLDSSARHILDALIAEAASAGTTVVIASHETASVEHLATRVVVLAGGRVTGERMVPRLAPPASSGADAAGTIASPSPAAPGSGALPVGGSMSHVA
jgi:heme ABC exporter ATP-binding subunit CcmA